MQNGQYIVDRLIVKMIREICEVNGIAFTAFSDNWLLSLERDGVTRRVLGYKFDVNNAVAAGIAQDKVASYQLLERGNIAVVPHYLIRTKATEEDWKSLPWEKGMVIKPLSGTSGHSVAKLHSVAEAEAWMSKWGIEAWAASPFFEIRREVRVITLDGMVLLTYEKMPVEISGLKFFNLGKGAMASDYTLGKEQRELVVGTQRTLGLRLAAIDLVELTTGEWRVLEVNDGIMMENYARQSRENEAVAKEVYAAIIAVLFREEQAIFK